jgi:predicted PurR-regulated permease PerM
MEDAPRARRLDVRFPASAVVRVLLALLVVLIAIKLWLAFLLFLIAVLFAVTLDPAVRWLEDRGTSRTTGILALAFLTFALIGTAVVLVVPPLFTEVSLLVRDFEATRGRIDREFPSDSPILKSLVGQILALPDSPEVRAWFARPLVWGLMAVEILSGGLVVLMSALYLLLDGKRTYTWLLSYVPRRHRRRMALTVAEVSEVVRSYVRGQFITSVLCGAYTFVLLSFLGIPAALPLAIAAALLDVVPILGTVVITLLCTLLALTVSPFSAIVVFAANLLYHLFENYVIAPRVYGRNLRLSTLSVMLALVVGGVLQGILGAVLVLPLVAAYPIIERIWLRKYLGADVVGDHAALAESADTTQELEVENQVIHGQEPDQPPPCEETPAKAGDSTGDWGPAASKA